MSASTAISWTDATTLKRGVNSTTGRPGPAPHAPRDGDKDQARHRVNVEVRTGRRPPANDLPCVGCGHVWRPGERRHEYDHYLGYSPQHHLDVEPVCTLCHHQRDNPRVAQTHCVRGHEFKSETTIVRSNGTRACRECHRIRDRGRHDAAYWRAYRERKASNV